MDAQTVGAGGKVVSTLGDAGGAIGIICGLLLISMLLFFRYLMESVRARDAEVAKLNQKMQEALIANTAAMSSLIHVLQNRSCLARDNETLNHIRNESNTVFINKKD